MNRRGFLKAALGSGATLLVVGHKHNALAQSVTAVRVASRTFEDVNGSGLIVSIGRHKNEKDAKREFSWLEREVMDEWLAEYEEGVEAEYEEIDAVDAGDESVAFRILIRLGIEIRATVNYVRQDRCVYTWLVFSDDDDAIDVMNELIVDTMHRYDGDEIDTDEGLLDQLPSEDGMKALGYSMTNEAVGEGEAED